MIQVCLYFVGVKHSVQVLVVVVTGGEVNGVQHSVCTGGGGSDRG